MSSRVVPVLRWQVVSEADDELVRVSSVGQHLATWQDEQAPTHNQRLMRDYVSLAVAVSCFRFTFPRTFSALESNLDLLEDHAANSGVNGVLTERERRGDLTTASGPVL